MTTPPAQSTESAGPHHVKLDDPEDAASGPKAEEPKSSSSHITLEEPAEVQHHNHDAESGQGLKNDKGWDGKLRVDRATLANPDAISDPEYSDEENVLQGETISADEGLFASAQISHPK